MSAKQKTPPAPKAAVAANHQSKQSENQAVCPDCNLAVVDDCAQCTLCQKWSHYKCLGITYNAQTANKVRDLLKLKCVLTVCNECQRYVSKGVLHKNIAVLHAGDIQAAAPPVSSAIDVAFAAKLQAQMDDISANLKHKQAQMDDITANLKLLTQPLIPAQPPNSNISDLLDDSSAVDNAKPPLLYADAVRHLAPVVAKAVSDATDRFRHDFNAREEEKTHQRSIVIMGLPQKANAEVDNASIKELIKRLDPSATVERCWRMPMGRPIHPNAKRGGPARPRLVKVVFYASAVARGVLNQSRKLGSIDAYKNVYLRPSMPLAERQQLQQQRAKYNEARSYCDTLNDARKVDDKCKFVVGKENMILRYVDCLMLQDGKLGRGTLDATYNFDYSHLKNNSG